MNWAKKLFGLSLSCVHCGANLRHDYLWSLVVLVVFTTKAYLLITYLVGAWIVLPILLIASAVIIMTPLKHRPGKE